MSCYKNCVHNGSTPSAHLFIKISNLYKNHTILIVNLKVFSINENALLPTKMAIFQSKKRSIIQFRTVPNLLID